MKKILLFSLVGISLFSLGTLLTNNTTLETKKPAKTISSLSKRSSVNVNDKVVLRIKNMEDYIYMTDDDPDAFIHQFEEYADAMGYHDVDVVYSTTDTNETLYSQLLTGKANYDLICPSEYMIQKMIREDLIQKIDTSNMDNYNTYASSYIRNRFDSIQTTDINGNDVTLGEYGVGYMWGTLGLLFNPYYANYNPGQAIEDAAYWDMLWNTNYNGTISIKDSMRDTYAMAVLQVYKEELITYREAYESGDLSASEYNEMISEVFNRCDDETIKKVETILDDLRGNIFGLEVDSGKSDIVSGKIGINFAWSGDAVYSMELGEEEDKELCYSIPLLGSNLWFDAWVMPKDNDRTPLQTEVAYLFLDFLSTPQYARENMEYTGYTSFIGGEDIRDLVRDWYDIRTDELRVCTDEENETYASIYRLNPNNVSDYQPLTYDDFLTTDHNATYNNYELVYFQEDDDGNIIDDTHYSYVYLTDENGDPTSVIKTYGDLTIVDAPDSQLDDVDLNYFFNSNFVNDESNDLSEYHFYTDSYFYSYEDEGGTVYQNIAVGRQFFCQYPDLETITRCAVMKDFGKEANEAVLAMWERFKSTSLPIWATILFVTEIALGVGLVTYFFINKKINYRLRQKRKELDRQN